MVLSALLVLAGGALTVAGAVGLRRPLTVAGAHRITQQELLGLLDPPDPAFAIVTP